MGCLADEQLYAFVQGDMDRDALAGIDAHLDECATCRRLVVELVRTASPTSGSPAAPDALARGDTVGRYVILGVLGRGGMGVVYTAYDAELDRKVALKLVRDQDEQGRARLLREAQSMARLSHPNVVGVYGVERAGGALFLAMEYVHGRNLREWLADRPRADPDITRVFIDAGRGLAAAHSVGVIHRDFKPDNVFIDREGRARVGDFGLARQSEEDAGEPDQELISSGRALATTVTRTGALLGTPAYMAPEQHAGRELDERCDQFSFCVALHEALVGSRPFVGANLAQLRAAVLGGERQAIPSGRRLPGRIRRVLSRGLSTRRDDRFGSMTELLEALDPPASRARLWVSAASAAVVVAAGAVAYSYGSAGDGASLCGRAQAQISAVWSSQRMAAIEAAFADTGAPHAGASARSVANALDAYAAEWRQMKTDACEATHVHHQQSEHLLDLRTSCLDRRLGDLGALATLLTEADRDIVDKAGDAARSLPSLDSCANAEALLAVEPPAADAAPAVAEQRALLSEARALLDAGKYERAMAIAAPVIERSEKLGYRPLQAEALLIVGMLHGFIGELEDAESALKRGLAAAQAGRHDEEVASIAAQLVYIVGHRRAQFVAGRDWARFAEASVLRIGGDARTLGEINYYVGHIARAQGEHAEALAAYERAAELWTGVHGADDPRVASAIDGAGTVLRSMGKYDEALEHHTAALDTLTRALGETHPTLGYLHTSLGNLSLARGDPAGAVTHHKQALAIWEQSLGPEHSDRALALGNVGTALAAAERYDEALEVLARALALRIKLLGEEHHLVASTHATIGDLYRVKGSYEESLDPYRRAIEIGERALGSDHPRLAHSLSGLGRSLTALGRPREALPLLERAVAIAETREMAPDDRGKYRLAMAQAMWAAGQNRAAAVHLAESAIADYREADPAGESKELAEAEGWLAEHRAGR